MPLEHTVEAPVFVAVQEQLFTAAIPVLVKVQADVVENEAVKEAVAPLAGKCTLVKV